MGGLRSTRRWTRGAPMHEWRRPSKSKFKSSSLPASCWGRYSRVKKA